MTDFRVVVSGFDRANGYLMPHSALKDVWTRRLKPLKKPIFIDRFGVSLMGLELRHFPAIDDTKDFEAICMDNGLGTPLSPAVRFLVADSPITNLPTLSPGHEMLTAISIGTKCSWGAHPNNAAVTKIEAPAKDIKFTIFDTLLDFSFANSYAPQFIFLRTIPNRPDLYREKVKFALEKFKDLSAGIRLHPDSPYVSFSALCRKNGKFGSNEHTAFFVEIWDQFFHWLLTKSQTAELYSDLICNYPKIGRQLSPSAIQKCIPKDSPGTYLFVARRKSKDNASNDVQNRLKGLFSAIPIRGTGVREIGFVNTKFLSEQNTSLAEQIERLANEGYLYVIRTHIQA